MTPVTRLPDWRGLWWYGVLVVPAVLAGLVLGVALV